MWGYSVQVRPKRPVDSIVNSIHGIDGDKKNILIRDDLPLHDNMALYRNHAQIMRHVYSRANEAEEYGWWQARVKMLKGEFAVMEFTGWDTSSYTDKVPLKRIRTIDSNCKDENAHTEFKKHCNAVSVSYNDNEGHVLFCDSVIKRAIMLGNMHLRYLRQKLLLKQTTEEAVKRLQNTKIRSGYMEEFTVREDLMGLAIGSHGANIQLARRVDGITGIELDENTCTFKVHGDSQESVKKSTKYA